MADIDVFMMNIFVLHIYEYWFLYSSIYIYIFISLSWNNRQFSFQNMNISDFGLHLQIKIRAIAIFKKCESRISLTENESKSVLRAFFRQAVGKQKNTRVLRGHKTHVSPDFIGIWA